MAGAGDALRIEARAGAELAALHTSGVFWGRGVPRGDGRTVVVVPGLFGNDLYLRPLRDWLRRIGYRPQRSSLTINAGCPKRLVNTIDATLERQLASTAEPIALVGHSRGGMLCWAYASRLGARVSHLALLGSPAPAVAALFRYWQTFAPSTGFSPMGGTNNAVAAAGQRALRLLDPDCNVPACRCEYVDDVLRPLSPSTKVLSIASTDDPIVPPTASDLSSARLSRGENVLVRGSHSGLAHNRAVYELLAGFLAE